MMQWVRRAMRFLAVGPAARVSLGLTSLVVSMVLMADLVFGLLPDPNIQLRQLRARTAENLAIQTANQLEAGSPAALDRLFKEVMARDKSMLSLALRRSDGQVMAQAGDHQVHWVAPKPGQSVLDHIQVPMDMSGRPWGAVEVSFERATIDTVWRWLRQPSVFMVVLLGLGSFAGFTLYLRRVLAHLDPSAVIPDRVRSAFDVFAGGVMIVDPAGRLMLVNAALRRWMGGQTDAELQGKQVESVDWFRKALPVDRKEHPWWRAMDSANATEGEYLEFQLNSGEALKVVVNASPISDAMRKVRGCLVTFDNVTPLHELNAQLVKSMSDLEESKLQIEKKNDELRRLATRDPLTGCLNRRALFEQLEQLFMERHSSAGAMCCIMSDIDHFKSFNDRYGHAVGDQVLQTVTRSLSSALREVDLLCRYGGEEFCIILPEVDLAQALSIAERLREDIERRAGSSVRSTAGLVVTSSFGVAQLTPDVGDPAQLIDMADKALYAAKHAGRNRVMPYSAQVETTA